MYKVHHTKYNYVRRYNAGCAKCVKLFNLDFGGDPSVPSALYWSRGSLVVPGVCVERAGTIYGAMLGRSGVPEVVREHFPAAADRAMFWARGSPGERFTARTGDRDHRSQSEQVAVIYLSKLHSLRP